MWLKTILRHFRSRPGERRVLDLAQLEDRVMLSASPVAAVLEGAEIPVDAHDDGAIADQVAAQWQDSRSEADSAARDRWAVNEGAAGTRLEDQQADRFASSEDAQQLRRELVVIDSSVDNYEQLVDDIVAQQSDSLQFEVFLLDAGRDGVEQISNLLTGYSSLDAIHIISHGDKGNVGLGNIWLNQDTIHAYAGQIARWQDTMSNDADLLFYGCNLAQSENGRSLIDGISALTGADVAASTDDTGHAIFGADWDLEYAAGQIETNVAFSTEFQQNWGHVLNVAIDASSSGSTTDQASVTVSHTTSGSNRLMLVGVSTDPHGECVASVTYNGGNLTLVGSEEDPSSHSRVRCRQFA